MTTAAPDSAQFSSAATPATTAPSRKKLIAGAIAAAAVALGCGWYVTHRGLESTDDAQTDADVVAVPARVAGSVTKLYFAENQQVKAGDLLAELDDATARAKLAQAEAALAAASAA